MQEESATLPIGAVIRKRYLVESQLSEGGSGAVYLVRDQRVRNAKDNLFVLKKIKGPSQRKWYRLTFEDVSLKQLYHHALPCVHGVFNDNTHDWMCMLMEYIEGPNLETLRQQQTEQRFTWLETMNIMASIIAAVSYLHDQQPPIIHGDIKPTNIIMLKAENRAVLVDFGTAKRYDLDSRTGVNHSPTIRSYYRAPEQYTTGPNLQSDIYSLGATCYTLVTGIVPPDSPSRLKQVGNGEIDPLQPVNEVQPTVPAHVARAIDRAMSLDADNRFLSVERFWEALWSLVEYPSTVSSNRPSAPSHLPMITKQTMVRPAVVSVPKQPRPPRAWKFGPFWPFAPKQATVRPATVSIAKYRHTPRPSIPAVTEQTAEKSTSASVAEQPPPVLPSKPAIPEQAIEEPTLVSVAGHPQTAPELVAEQPPPVPPSQSAVVEQTAEEPAPASVTEQSPPPLPPELAAAEQGVEVSTPALVAEQPPLVTSLEPAVAEQAVEEPAPALVAEQSLLNHPSEPAVAEQVVEEPTPILTAEQPRMAPTSVAEQAVEKSARASLPKQPRALYAWKLVVLLIVLVLVIGLGIRADISSRVLTKLAASATSTPSSFRPTPTAVPTTYPTLAGTYRGTIFDIPANVRTSLTFTDVRQNQGHISGYLTVGPGLLGYGPFSGTIDTAKHLQFTVTDADGNPTLFFEGAIPSATSLSGDYYRCNPAQGSPCVRGPVGYGLWNVLASSSSGTSTGTNPSPGL